MKKIITVAALLPVLWLSPLSINAQVTAAVNTDNLLTIPNPFNAGINANFLQTHAINADMVDVSAGGKLWAVAVKGLDNNTSSSYAGLHVEFNGSTPFADDRTVPDTREGIDVVIADNTSGTLGQDYLVAVVYLDASDQVAMDVHEYTGIGTGSPMHASVNTYILNTPISTPPMGSLDFLNPHIDLFGDGTNTSFSGTHQLHDFVVSYDVAYVAPTTNRFEVYCSYGTLLPGGSCTINIPSSPIATNAHHSDVAAQTTLTPPGSNSEYSNAWITYIDFNTQSLNLVQVPFDNTFSPLTPVSTMLDNMDTYGIPPRIEAQPLADITPSVATWNVLGLPGGGPFAGSMCDFNDGTGGWPSISFIVNGSSLYNAPAADYIAACVTGVGPNMQSGSTGIGTTEFSIGALSNRTYNPPNPLVPKGDYYSSAMDINTGNWSSTYGPYYEVNTNEVNMLPVPQHHAVMATANSSNTGDDQLTVWAEGDFGGTSYLRYKFSGNGYSYKTTGVAKTDTKQTYSVSPNPSVDHLTVTGAFNASYTIINMTGATVMKGNIDTRRSNINTLSLVPGVYLLNITENGYTQRVKFTKS